MAELCIPKNSMFSFFVCLFVCLFVFSILTLFLSGKWHHKIDIKIKISRYGKTNNLKRARQVRMKCFDLLWFFLIFRHFVTIFRNINTFQDAISPKTIVFFQNLFSHLFLSRHVLSKLFICFAMTWNLNFDVNLVTVVFPQKSLKSKNKKPSISRDTKFYHPIKLAK